jgi:hypothetical protein
MSIQHSAIADSDRHENKGASTATSGQVLQANGDGTTTFVDPSTLANTVSSVVLSSSDTTHQVPSATDTAIQVTLGSATSGTDITLSSAGLITFNTTAYYIVTFTFNCSRDSTAGITSMLMRLLINGTAQAPTYLVELPAGAANITRQISIQQTFTSGNTLAVQFMNDSANTGLNVGGLNSFTPVNSAWSVVPGASVKIQKVLGAS